MIPALNKSQVYPKSRSYLMAPPMSKLFADKLQEHVFKTILWAPEDIIEEYKLQFLGVYLSLSMNLIIYPEYY
jgi:hypothetical protein